MKTGIIFDLDGTLWDSSAAVSESWNEALKSIGVDKYTMTVDKIRGYMGQTMEAIAYDFFSEETHEEAMRLLNICADHENDYILHHGGVLYEGLEETLAKLKEAGYFLSVVSNCQAGYIEAFIEYHQLAKYFDDTENYGKTGKEKADNIKLVVERNNLDKAYYVGDIMGDYNSTMEAGINFIHASYGFGTVPEGTPKIKAITELPEFMQTVKAAEVMKSEINENLNTVILPFWKRLKDEENGGFYGYFGTDLKLDKNADKGCILHSRILWFFSNAYLTLKDEDNLAYAKQAYEFIRDCCIDKEYGGIFWSVTADGKPADPQKHTYNQAFCIYALSSYYVATGDEEALKLAQELINLIESKMRDEGGYLEAFNRDFTPDNINEKLSENGVVAGRTMNTLLHVMEAYTEYYRVTKEGAPLRDKVKSELYFMLDVLENKIYNPEKTRQEVFFDLDMNSIIDLHSYGHDIETSWLADRTLEVLGDDELTARVRRILTSLAECIYNTAYTGSCVLNENERGKDDTTRVWWVQNESVIGFVNAYQRTGDAKYLKAAENVWEYCKEYFIDKRAGSEWFNELNEDGSFKSEKEIAGEWKCPYHNGRMCFEILNRVVD
ncbi:MAG: AGE family epimerase/isomerase [Lachnospiraceae bacterium]|nr:AGE family epimerase/isomerase [Lachnospiraceae bacterium]